MPDIFLVNLPLTHIIDFILVKTLGDSDGEAVEIVGVAAGVGKAVGEGDVVGIKT